MLDVRLTPKAEETYQILTEQLQLRWGQSFVAKLESKVEKAVRQISISPYMYPIADEGLDMRKCVLHKNCSLFYQVYDAYILITFFWDNRQKPIL